MKWGGGNAAALERINTLTLSELQAGGVTAAMANNWAAAYEAIALISPTNPSAAGRAALMKHAAQLLNGT